MTVGKAKEITEKMAVDDEPPDNKDRVQTDFGPGRVLHNKPR